MNVFLEGQRIAPGREAARQPSIRPRRGPRARWLARSCAGVTLAASCEAQHHLQPLSPCHLLLEAASRAAGLLSAGAPARDSALAADLGPSAAQPSAFVSSPPSPAALVKPLQCVCVCREGTASILIAVPGKKKKKRCLYAFFFLPPVSCQGGEEPCSSPGGSWGGPQETSTSQKEPPCPGTSLERSHQSPPWVLSPRARLF